MWQTLMTIVFGTLICSFLYLSLAVTRFHFIRSRIPSKRWKRVLIGAPIMILVMVLLALWLGFISMVITIIHLLVFWIICDILGTILKRHISSSIYYRSGIFAIILTTVCLSLGWYNAHHVVATRYQLETEKNLGIPSLKVVAFSDSHLGATFHYQEFERYVDQINQENPDVVVIVGDYVDDSSSKEDLENCSKALSRLKAPHGIYYVYGNHDEGYNPLGMGRNYSSEELRKNLTENGVRILKDETVPLVGNIHLAGRKDRSQSREGRVDASELLRGLSPYDYVIMLDHQPNDYEAEAASGADLVLSGHTHGGQFWGFGPIGVLIGANDSYYGYQKRGNTDFIVSSGIGNWEIKFKTGCIAEYVVVDIH